MQLKLSIPLRLFLLAGVVAALGVTESFAYINLGFKSRQELEDFCKRHNLDPEKVSSRDVDLRKPRVVTAADYCDRADDCARSPITWHLALKFYDQAIAQEKLGQFIPEAYLGRGNVWWQKKDYARAVAEFREAVKQVEGNAWSRSTGRATRHYLHLAAACAVCPDPKLRSQAEALKLAQRACEVSRWPWQRLRDPDAVEVLAAIHAQGGDFAAAVKWQSRAVEMRGPEQTKKLELCYEPDLEKAAKRRLGDYQQRRTAWGFDWFVTGAVMPHVGKAERSGAR